MGTQFDLSRFVTALKAKRGQQSLRDVAEQCGVNASTLSRIENGAVPELDTLTTLCDWLGRSPGDFFSEDVVSSGQRQRLTLDALTSLSEAQAAVHTARWPAVLTALDACRTVVQELAALATVKEEA